MRCSIFPACLHATRNWRRQSWLMTKAAGRSRFIWRQMLYSLAFWLILMPLLDLLAFKTNPLFVQNILIDLILLPLCLFHAQIFGRQMEMAGLGKEVPRRHSPIGRIASAFKKLILIGCEAMVVRGSCRVPAPALRSHCGRLLKYPGYTHLSETRLLNAAGHKR